MASLFRVDYYLVAYFELILDPDLHYDGIYITLSVRINDVLSNQIYV